jgi:trimeric autotransporter adhesin
MLFESYSRSIFASLWGGYSPASAESPPQPNIVCGAPSDDCWARGFHLPGVVGTVYALAADSSGNLYVGGEIISAGGIPVNNLAMWDGATWRDLSGGITRTSGTARIYALGVDGNDHLVVGGFFDQAGGVSASNLAVWTGSNWQGVGGGVNGSVMAIKMVSGGMYVGGYFDQVGTVPANNIAYRDFQTLSWLALGSGVDDTVYAIALETSSNNLFVGGEFSTAGGVSAVRIARYDRNSLTWHAVGGGLMTLGGTVSALLPVPRDAGGYDLFVGGSFPQVGEVASVVEAHNVARWDGSAWHELAYGTGGAVIAFAYTSAGELIVGGDFSTVGSSAAVAAENVAKWNGSTWSAMGAGLGTQGFEEVNALLLVGGEVFAGGDFDLSGSQVVNNLARWNGSAWTAMDGGLGVNNTVDVLLADGSGVYAAGNITQFGSLQALGLAKLTSSTWSSEGSPAGYNIRALAKFGLTTLYAGGAFTSIGGAPANYLASWNGSAWSQLAGGTNGAVNSIVLDDSKLYVAGEFTSVGGGNPASRIAMWDGTWHALGAGLNGTVYALALDSSGKLYAAGAFTNAGSLLVNHVAMWDGSQWHALGGGLSGSNYVLALTFDSDGRLYAGGYFGYAGSVQANGVAMWNGLEWSALGSGMDDGVGALVVDSNGYLYAGGDFETAGGAGAKHIARWDGFNWSPLGSGTDSNVRALVTDAENLVVGGVFKKAGGIPSTNIGAYHFPPVVSAPSPNLASLVPTSTSSGGAGFWLTVNGTNFSSRSVVRWNGSPLTTTYLSGSQLRAYVPADKITAVGSAVVTVFTPAPSGGGVSSARIFEIVESYNVFIPLVLR